MARTTLTPELKKAILELPTKEKDKLLLRLLPSKRDLVKQLEFKLLEGGETTESRREELKKMIQKDLKTTSFYSPGYLLLDLRAYSGRITEHVKTTKDKLGEIELNFFMLNEAFDLFAEKLLAYKLHQSATLNEYVVQRTLKLLKLLSKMHEDYHLEFRDSMRSLGAHFDKNAGLKLEAKQAGLKLNWLLEGEVPETWEL